MSNSKHPITPEGYKNLKEELRRLKYVERPKNVRAIEDARGHGDISENAEYDAAKEKQGLLEMQIRELENRLADSVIIDPTTINSSTVTFGARVTLLDLDTEIKVEYQIVGDTESNLKEGKISISSPIAKALIGKSIGETTTVHTPRGTKELEILRIEFE